MMNKKTTFWALLIGAVAIFSINATIDQTDRLNDVDPIYYTFSDEVRDELQGGLDKFKEEYPNVDLTNDKFYVNFSQCQGEMTLMISYLNCKKCNVETLINSTNRFVKISNRLSLPVIFDVDLYRSDIFEAEGVRIRPTRKGYAVTVDIQGEILFSGFTDMN